MSLVQLICRQLDREPRIWSHEETTCYAWQKNDKKVHLYIGEKNVLCMTGEKNIEFTTIKELIEKLK